MNNKNNTIDDRCGDDDDNTFLDLRGVLFQELSEDVIVEVADLHGVPIELVLSKRHLPFDDEFRKNEEAKEEQSKNMERLLFLLKSGDPCCSNNCFRHFDKKALMRFAHVLDSCSKSEAETALLMNMLEHDVGIDITKRGKLRERQRVMYSVQPFGIMCREAFLRLWGVGERALRNLKAYQKENPGTFAPRVHGNANKSSHHTLPSSVFEAVVGFIKDVGKQVGEESEGRHMKRNNHAVATGVVRFLPAFYSVALLYRLFLAHYQEKHKLENHDPPPLSLRQFYYIFQSQDCGSVQIRSPRSDVCDICLLYRNKIRRHTGIFDENDEEDVSSWNDHVARAKEARNVYRNEIASAQQGFADFLAGHKTTKEYVPHATFDFAQNLGLPQLSNQPQDLYFVSQRAVQLFSIRDDGAGVQYNFLYDEGDGGKGGNYVASMLTLFLLDLSSQFKIRSVLLNADNCCAQNKNNIVLWVLELLVMLGIFDHIELKFLVKGHTHCSVDGGHGLIKKEWRKRDVFSIKQAKKVIEECSSTQRAIIISPNEFFDWSSFLTPYFRKLPGISFQQEFKFHKDHFGIVRYRSCHGLQWQSYSLLKSKLRRLPKALSSLESIKKRLKILKPPGIPAKKQWHLFKKASKYVPDELKDDLCPKPNVPEPPGDVV